MSPYRKLLLLALFLFSTVAAQAQSGLIMHVIAKATHLDGATTRELWFTMIANTSDTSGKYYQLYVTSPAQTNVYINTPGQATVVLPVQAYNVATFNIPLSWEIKSSAVVTDNAFHVWSRGGDLTAYVMSHSSHGSDGTALIPTLAWGKDYVVAAYNALYDSSAKNQQDFPSEFAIIANQDNTVITITPSADIRQESSPEVCCSCLAHPKGVAFTEILNRGQAVQYKTTCTQDANNFDFTGTIIHSNNPVGVMAGAISTNIPMPYPTPSYACEMIPPTERWGKSYYSAPFYPANPGKQYSTFLVVSSKPNQQIYRYDRTMTIAALYCTINQQYGINWQHNIDQPNLWTSDAPFLLVQYVNSSTYPNGVDSIGGPAEVVVLPLDQYLKTVIFQVPSAIGSSSPYRNYVNIITHRTATATTTFEGVKLSSQPHMQIDSFYEVTRIGGLKAGTHLAHSDSGMGVYIYGYGTGDGYAWNSGFGTIPFTYNDTIPPIAVASGCCYKAHVDLLDSGFEQSGLAYIRPDSAYNMAYNHDDSNWTEGAGRHSSFYDMLVIDSTRDAYLAVSVYDIAGNRTTIVSQFRAPANGVASEQASTLALHIFPNPARKELSVIYTLPRGTEATFDIYTILGERVYRLRENQSDGAHEKHIDISTLAPGSYYYRFEAAGEVTSGKITIAP